MLKMRWKFRQKSADRSVKIWRTTQRPYTKLEKWWAASFYSADKF